VSNEPHNYTGAYHNPQYQMLVGAIALELVLRDQLLPDDAVQLVDKVIEEEFKRELTYPTADLYVRIALAAKRKVQEGDW